MKKYVLYTPNEKDILKCDTVFIQKNIVNGELIKKYAGKNKLELAINYVLRNKHTLVVAFLQHLGSSPKEVIAIVERISPQYLICCETPLLSEEIIEILFYSKNRKDEYSALCSSLLKKGKTGTPENFSNEGRKKGGEVMKQKALNHPSNQAALSEIKRLEGLESKYTLQDIADRLNKLKIPTTFGKRWNAGSVKKLQDRNK